LISAPQWVNYWCVPHWNSFRTGQRTSDVKAMRNFPWRNKLQNICMSMWSVQYTNYTLHMLFITELVKYTVFYVYPPTHPKETMSLLVLDVSWYILYSTVSIDCMISCRWSFLKIILITNMFYIKNVSFRIDILRLEQQKVLFRARACRLEIGSLYTVYKM
jgi:hypothetical protein